MTKALWISALIASLTNSQAQSPSLVTPEVRAPRVQFHTFDSAAAKTKVSMWCDSQDGSVPMETLIIKELLPHIDTKFRTAAKREARIVEGFSMGGYGAARLGFKHHDLFAGVSILAGGPLDLELQGPKAAANPVGRERILRNTFGGDLAVFQAQSPWVLAEQHAAALRGKTRVRMAIGERDFTLDLNRKFSARLKDLTIPHTFTTVPGVGHDTMALLKGLGEANWEFYRSVFGHAAATQPAAKTDSQIKPATPLQNSVSDLKSNNASSKFDSLKAAPRVTTDYSDYSDFRIGFYPTSVKSE